MLYLFDKKEEFIATLPTRALKEAVQEEGINYMDRLDFGVLLPFRGRLKGACYVAHADRVNPDEFYYYKILTAGNTADSVLVTAIASHFDDLQGYGYLREHRRDHATAREAGDIVFSGSRWKLIQADETAQRAFYVYDLTRLEALKKLIDIYNVEVEFRVKIDKNTITRRTVRIHNRMGKNVHKRFFYGSNALEVIKEEDQKGLATAVIGRGRGEEKFDATGQSTGGFGRKINFKEVEWSKDKGDPLDKPLGQEYIELPEATKKWGYSDGTPRFKLVTHDKIDDPRELLEACYKDLMDLSRPLVQFKASILETGDVALGDGVQIIRKDLDIYYTARVFKVVRNLLNADLTQVELGDNLEYTQATRNKEFVNQISSLNDRVSEVAKSANSTFIEVLEEMREGLKNSYFNQDGYNYELRVGNPYKLPAGYYSFNAPIDKNPTKVIYMGAGTMAIANKKDSTGKWEWQTFGTGDGILAEAIVGKLGEFATVNANQITVNNDFARSELGKKVVVQDELYNNVKITQSKGVQVLDRDNRERVQLGNWATGRYGLKLTDPTGRRTVLDDQGILQSWQDSKCDNVASGKPLYLRLYIPKETKTIYKALLRVWTDYFRSFSVGAKYGGYKSDTTDSGGYDRSGDTSNYGGGDVVSSNVESWEYGDNGHNHGLKSGYSIWSAKPGADTGTYLGGFVASGLHTHSIQIPSHTHQFSFTIPSHTHRFTVDSHQHDIEYGIYEASSTGSNFEIFINGTDRTSILTGGGYFQGTQDELNITPYLSAGRWNTIEIRSRSLCRVDACVFIQALLQYAPS